MSYGWATVFTLAAWFAGLVVDEGIGGIIVDDLVGLLDDLLVIFGGHIALFFPYITGRCAAFQKGGKKQAVDG